MPGIVADPPCYHASPGAVSKNFNDLVLILCASRARALRIKKARGTGARPLGIPNPSVADLIADRPLSATAPSINESPSRAWRPSLSVNGHGPYRREIRPALNPRRVRRVRSAIGSRFAWSTWFGPRRQALWRFTYYRKVKIPWPGCANPPISAKPHPHPVVS
jgi:hypothetical protein